MILLATFTCLLYLTATVLQALRLNLTRFMSEKIILGIGLAAITLHALLLYYWIDTHLGQNLDMLNVFSLITWLIAVLILFTALRIPIANLCLFILPLAVVSIVLALAFPGQHIIATRSNPTELLHILLSILAFSVLGIASLQALVVALQDYRLHHKKTTLFHSVLPPLETMEILLFRMIAVGFVLLCLSLASGVWFMSHTLLTTSIQQKIMLSLIAWVVFALLLAGRHWFGWRGRTAIRFTLLGFGTLILAYFGTKLALL
jgi:ABC-type uncharacterized transport system permease subunit